MKEIVIIGAGNIGRGVVGGFFSKAGYKLHLYDVMAERMEALKKQGYYLVEATGPDDIERITVTDFDIVLGEEALIQRVAEVDLVACCVYEGAFASVCETLAAAIEERAKSEAESLNVLLCVNALGAPGFFRTEIGKRLSPAASIYFQKAVGICQVMVGMAALPSPKRLLAEDPFAVTIRKGGHIGVDKEAFSGETPVVEGLEMVDKAEAKIVRKVYTGNMKHAMTAFMGAAMGAAYIRDTYDDPHVEDSVNGAFLEAEAAVAKEYGFSEEESSQWITEILGAPKNRNLEDPLSRVTAGLKQKLSRENRFVGPALLCLKHQILPYYLARGIAYGFCYQDEENPESLEIAGFLAAKGIDEAVKHYCGLRAEDWILRDLIIKEYQEINKKLKEA